MYERVSNVWSRGEYKGIPYIIIFEGSYHYTIIAEGKEITTSSSAGRVRDKFEALVDTGYFDD